MSDTTQVCTGCGVRKAFSEFPRKGKDDPRPRKQCKVCCAARFRRNYAANPGKYRSYTSKRPYRSLLKRKRNLASFGLTIEQYDQMLERQSGVCAICGDTCSSGRRLAVDHCHTTGKVRELLCRRCNQSMGKFNDDPDLIQKVLDYLRKWEK